MAYEGDELLDSVTSKEYEFGFTTNIESDKAPAGLNEDIIRLISKKKEEPEWLLQWRLEAFAIWQKMTEPEWAHVHYTKPDFQAISYYAAPKQKKQLNSLDELDPEMRTDDTFWVPTAPPPLCKNVENALLTLQSMMEQLCRMSELEA
jgi:Fe-S cluster assembly protein SufB